MTHIRSYVAAALVAICSAALLGGCSSAGTGSSTGGGLTAPATGSDTIADSDNGATITLTIGTDDSPGVPSADQISHFIDAVSTLSDGAITVEPKWKAEGDGGLDWDQKVAAMVQRAELDLALGPSWAWDVLGVNSLQPLQSPFLVDSDALVAAIVTDDDLSGELLSELPQAGVVGISLWPEGLRHPFGFETPLLAAADYSGKTVRTPKSMTSEMIFQALGAQVTSEEPNPSSMAGTQSEYALSPNGTGAANVTFFPKVNVLYANADSYAKLDETERGVLAAAAAQTQKWAIARTDDVAAGREFCSAGGALVLAGDDDLTGLHNATKPVVDRIQAAHAETVAAIAALKADVLPVAYADACAPAETITSHGPGAAEAALNGTYRFTVSGLDFQQAGFSAADALDNAGVQTYVLQDGTVHYRLDPSERPFDAAKNDVVDGTYQVDGNQVTFRFPAWDNEQDRFRFSRAPEGHLALTFVESNGAPTIELLMASKVWERIA